MKKKISVKLLSLVGVLILIGVFSNLLSLKSVNLLEDKSNVITKQCLTAVYLLSETSRSVERVQRFANATTDSEENTEFQQEDKGLTDLFTQLQDIITGFQDEQLSEAYENYQKAYMDYTAVFGQMQPEKQDNQDGQVEQEGVQMSSDAIQNYQEEMEQYSLALDNAYTSLNMLMQDKVTQATEEMNLQTSLTEKMNWFMSLIMLAFGVIIAFITIKTIIHPLKSVKRQIEEMILGIERKEGDLTARIYIRNQDELGALVNGINQFIEHLQRIIGKLKKESDQLNISSNAMINQVDQSKENLMNVSSIMEELSASMEEVTATIEEFGSEITNVTTSVKDINSQMSRGNELSKEIKERSNTFQNNAKQGKEMTSKMIHDIRSCLDKSLEESKSVEKIKELTEEILDISSKTNLLALNASIEAARAGAAGAGFTVVAEQIRDLADSSRATANNIHEISELVMSGVNNLADNSTKMIEYVDSSILKDYERFVDVTSQYNCDAESINDIIGSVTSNAGILANTMNQMQAGVNEIVTTIDESTRGITEVAESTSGLVSSMEEVKQQADTNQEIGRTLMDEVNVFQKMAATPC